MANLGQFLDEDSLAKDDLDFSKLIDVSSDVVRPLLGILLQDKTTKKNIVWATDAYELHGKNCSSTSPITEDLFFGRNRVCLRPRIEKALDQQLERTRKKAEVFTPVWICNQMNNHLDEEWFGTKGIFNHENEDNSWTVVEESVHFPEGKTWKDYVDSRRLEITCGEAPYLVSRYDASTGLLILPPMARVGILDRKLRIVNENATSKEEWDKWVGRAYQSCYGYEWQGDSLLIARINLLMTFHEYHVERWGSEPEFDQLKRIANIIAWNLWQMDGLKDTVPYGKPFREQHQTTLFDSFESFSVTHDDQARPCKIYDWRRDNSVLFKKCKSRGKMGKKLFDFVIGNPPYQEINDKNGRQPPVYHRFMDAAYEVGGVVELITPARFLFNSGQTPKDWNYKMLNDEHFKVLLYESDASEIFQNTDIKGGIAISIHDYEKLYGKIGIFTEFNELNGILKKTIPHCNSNLSQIAVGAVPYKFTEALKRDYPQFVGLVGDSYDLRTNVFDKLYKKIFFDNKDDEKYIEIYGLLNKKRKYLWVNRDYVETPDNFGKNKILLPKANGSGKFGESFSKIEVAGSDVGHTQSFISLGCFDLENEAVNLKKYICCKFSRCLLSVLKTTQDITPQKWKYVPMQDFTDNSDIDWSKSISEIDQQLYRKYGLSDEEIEFIETHVQEMK